MGGLRYLGGQGRGEDVFRVHAEEAAEAADDAGVVAAAGAGGGGPGGGDCRLARGDHGGGEGGRGHGEGQGDEQAESGDEMADGRSAHENPPSFMRGAVCICSETVAAVLGGG